MYATSVLMSDAALMASVVGRIEDIIRASQECAAIDGKPCFPPNHLPTFVAVMRNLSIFIEEDSTIRFSLAIPTSSTGFWISDLDPFLLADFLRDMDVDLTITVFDIENQCGPVVQFGKPEPFPRINFN